MIVTLVLPVLVQPPAPELVYPVPRLILHLASLQQDPRPVYFGPPLIRKLSLILSPATVDSRELCPESWVSFPLDVEEPVWLKVIIVPAMVHFVHKGYVLVLQPRSVGPARLLHEASVVLTRDETRICPLRFGVASG